MSPVPGAQEVLRSQGDDAATSELVFPTQEMYDQLHAYRTLTPDQQQELRAVELHDEARFGLDEMRVLVSARQGLDAALVAAYFLRQRREVLGRRDYFEVGRGDRRRAREQGGCARNREEESFHDDHLITSGCRPQAESGLRPDKPEARSLELIA